MSDALLDVRDLSIFFRSDHRRIDVVSGVSFGIGRGQVFGLVGESGCGKSMTALSVLRLLPTGAAAEGRVLFDAVDLFALPDERMRSVRGKDIAMIFQEPMTSLNPVLTVGFQIAETLVTHFDISKKEARAQAVELLRAVKIPAPEQRVKDYPHQLSGGMRQRVMIAIAIACNPSLLIADEPTTALDVTIQAQILELLQGLRRERQMAVLLITHDLSIVSEHADRVAVMYAGRIVELAPVEELFRNTLHPYTIGLINSVPGDRGTSLVPIGGTVPPPGKLPAGCTFSDRCPLVIDECHAAEPELREIGPGHFARCIRV